VHPTFDRVVFTDHAVGRLAARGLHRALVDEIIARPEGSLRVRPGRFVLQARRPDAARGEVYLVRVFIDVQPGSRTAVVVTAYRTRRFGKYGSPPP
jgi:hypothetical protein